MLTVGNHRGTVKVINQTESGGQYDKLPNEF